MSSHWRKLTVLPTTVELPARVHSASGEAISGVFVLATPSARRGRQRGDGRAVAFATTAARRTASFLPIVQERLARPVRLEEAARASRSIALPPMR